MRHVLGSLALLAFAPTLASAQTPSFLWSATSEKGTVYLLGSIHLMRPDAYPLSEAIEQAYAAADALVFELDLDEMQTGAVTMMQRGLYADGSALCDHVTAETCALVAARIEESAMLRPVLERAEPWLAGMLLTTTALQQAGYQAELGLDMHFYTRARADGKPHYGLETLDAQVDFFDTMSPEMQEQFLQYSLAQVDQAVAQVDTMATLWKKGDAPALARLAFADLDAMPDFRARVLTERNTAWVPQIEALVSEGRTPLVVVGALHLLGDDGLLALLEARGYTIAQY